jgi:hypothetical protein
MPTVYSHMQRHQSKDTRAIEVQAPTEAVPLTDLEESVVSSTPHERGLDEIIVKGRQAVRDGTIKITAQALLQAIKTKSEIDIRTKDRRLDAFKMMAGAFSGNKDTNDTSEATISHTEG